MPRLACCAFLLFAATLQAADPFEGLDAYVAKALKSHGAPGVGVAVVQDGKTILARGFGVKEIGKTDPVTEKSLFAIGSVSKSFTSALIAMLVDEKKMRWDDPVRQHLPNFRMADRFYTDELTIRDCLAHRAGLPRHDLVWYGARLDRDEVLARLPQMKTTAKIRTTFMYNNILYLAAGQAAGKVAKTSWDDLLAERLFKPLGMKTANASIKDFAKSDDVATPHVKIKNKSSAVPVPWRNADNAGPAGSINACAAEMAEYIKLQLAKGKYGGKQLIERDTFAQLHRPVNLLDKPEMGLNPDCKIFGYGLGWFVSEFCGTTMIEHGGNIDGMTASVILLPEKKLGVVVLCNLNGTVLSQALAQDLLERVLGVERRNFAETSILLTFIGDMGIQYAPEPNPGDRVKDTKPSFALEKYQGKYDDGLYAPLLVKLEPGNVKSVNGQATFDKDKLSLDAGAIVMDLEHWHYDTFIAADRRKVWPKMLVTFDQSSEGKVAALRIKPQGEELRFKKVSDRPKP